MRHHKIQSVFKRSLTPQSPSSALLKRGSTMRADVPQLLKQTLECAKASEREGSASKAADSYEKAAKLMLEYARQAVSRDAEMRRAAKARSYQERATALREGRVELPDETTRHAGDDLEPSSESARQHQAMIAPLKQKTNVAWDDIGGLEDVKREIKFTYGLALAGKPDGVQLRGARNILLFGPPGTGKTLLAAATSASLNAAFFNVKTGSLLSKWFGESPKLISALYDTARSEADEGGFAVVFIDEFDALSLSRDSNSLAGAERRVLSAVLSELDGLKEKGEDRFVLTIAATNAPWDLDNAVLSRFQKRIYIPMPDPAARPDILRVLLEKRGHKLDVSYDELIARTDGFSGRDLERLTNEAVGVMVSECNPDIPQCVERGPEAIRDYIVKIVPLNSAHFDTAFKKVKVNQERVAEQERRFMEFAEAC